MSSIFGLGFLYQIPCACGMFSIAIAETLGGGGGDEVVLSSELPLGNELALLCVQNYKIILRYT